MKRILINENREKADAFIQRIQELYTSKVGTLKSMLGGLGVENVSKEMLLAVVDGDFEAIREKVFEVCAPDLKAASSPIARETVVKSIDSKLGEVRAFATSAFSKLRFKNEGVNLSSIKAIFEIEENGLIRIPDEKLAIIREGFKEYLDEDSAKVNAFKLHQEAAQKLTACIKALAKADLLDPFYIGNGLVFATLFRFEQNEKTGEHEVHPKPINTQAYREYQQALRGEPLEEDDPANR